MRECLRRMILGLAIVAGSPATVAPVGAADARDRVDLPPMIEEHMLANMRDHLAALDEILAALAEDRLADATAVAEERLGMTSMTAHGAAHMAPFMPQRMREIGTGMHRAASRFVIAAENADLRPADERAKVVFGALQEITSACTSCHQAFRIR